MPRQIKLSVLFFGFAGLFFMACNSGYTPKPTGYYKIDFPEKKYQLFDAPGYPYAFEYPIYAKVVKDSTFFGEATENEWWINVDFPQFNGRIYVSYKEIGKYKFDLIGMEYYLSASKYSSGGWIDLGIFNKNITTKEQLDMIYKKDGSLRASFKHIQDVPLYFNNLNKSLLDSINSESAAIGDW